MTTRGIKALTILLASILTFLAQTTSASACYWGLHQPKEPKLLREE